MKHFEQEIKAIVGIFESCITVVQSLTQSSINELTHRARLKPSGDNYALLLRCSVIRHAFWWFKPWFHVKI